MLCIPIDIVNLVTNLRMNEMMGMNSRENNAFSEIILEQKSSTYRELVADAYDFSNKGKPILIQWILIRKVMLMLKMRRDTSLPLWAISWVTSGS